MRKQNPNKIIDRLNGTSAVAKLCGVTPQAVSQWRHNGIPRITLLYLQEIRPEAFNAKKRSK